MKNSGIKALLSAGLILCAAIAAARAQDPYQAVLGHLVACRVDSALALANRLAFESPSNPYCAYLRSLALYEAYGFREALSEAARSIENLPSVPGEVRGRLIANHLYLEESWKILSAFKEIPGERFIFCYADPRDRILAGEVLQVLDSAWVHLGKDLGFFPRGKIRVEIYPDRASFITVSTLSEDEVTRTGTIALSKFNRLLFVSPRVIARGYRWKETVCHEYAHYLVACASGNRVPIWLHEGVAHYEEVRFDGRKGNTLSALEQDLLYRALRDNALVPFSRMHPSMAKLKDAEESGTAFAEVLLAVRFLIEKAGVAGLRNILSGCGKGLPLDSLLKAAVNSPSGFEQAFFDDLRRHPVGPVEGVSVMEREFADSAGPGADESYRFRKYVAVSEMLLERQRVDAAIRELARADGSRKSRSPWVLNEIGLLFEKHGEPDKAAWNFGQSIALFPEYCTGYFNRARFRAGRNDFKGAEEDYLSTLDINPFHLPAREALATLYRKQGRPDLERGHREILRQLAGVEKEN